jgi:hypothetical protein
LCATRALHRWLRVQTFGVTHCRQRSAPYALPSWPLALLLVQ